MIELKKRKLKTRARSKKAIFYMFTVIVFLGIMSIIMYTYQSYSLRDKQEAVEIRLIAMNDFINDFNNDVHRSTRISATRALIALEDYVSTNEEYFSSLDDFNNAFKELFYEGAINGVNHSLMIDSSFSDYETKVSGNANSIGLNFLINVTKIQLVQEDPWNVQVIIDAHIKLNDTSKLAYWDFNGTFVTSVPVDGLRDPLYSINTNGRLQNTVRKSNISMFVNGTDTSGLIEHIQDGYYIEESDAPSFIMRFYANLSSSPYGIESIVNIPSINDQGLPVDENAPVIDYKYFSGDYNANACDIENMPSWFKLETTDLNSYNLTGFNYTTC